jgi:hypothetical protein
VNELSEPLAAMIDAENRHANAIAGTQGWGWVGRTPDISDMTANWPKRTIKRCDAAACGPLGVNTAGNGVISMAALRGKKPKAIEKRLKAMFLGSAGAGKTTAAIQFPKVYLIDTERGAENDQYVKSLEAGGGAYFPTNDFEDMVREITTLLSVKHEFKTVVIDPLTVVYNDLLDKAEKKVGSEFGRHYAEANKRMKHLLNLLLRLDMNVIVTCHSKNEYGQDMKVIGTTFDCYKKLDYLFDLVIEVSKRGKERVGIVRKTRLENFADGEVFPFSYAAVAEKYGRDVLERDASPEVLASADQVAELKRLVELLKVPVETTDKWLDKAQAETWSEMSGEAISKCIDHLNKTLAGKEAA